MERPASIEAILPDGTTCRLDVEIKRCGDGWALSVEDPALGRRRYEGVDMFEALIEMRRRLAREGVKLLCAGARRDVWPSAMSRQMSGGRKAYVLKMGRGSIDVVDIFDAASPELIASVEEQREFHNQWFLSWLK